MKKILIVLFMAALATSAYADKESTTVNNYYTTEEYITEQYITEESSSTTVNNNAAGIALSIATAQHHFDFGTEVWQGSVGVGRFNGNTATSFALAKKFNRILFTGTVGKEEGSNLNFGAGLGWRF